jgi:hypothetical protein
MTFTFQMAVPDVVEFWRVYYGPTNRAFEALAGSPDKQAALRADLERLWSSHNLASGTTTQVDSEFLEAVGVKRDASEFTTTVRPPPTPP